MLKQVICKGQRPKGFLWWLFHRKLSRVVLVVSTLVISILATLTIVRFSKGNQRYAVEITSMRYWDDKKGTNVSFPSRDKLIGFERTSFIAERFSAQEFRQFYPDLEFDNSLLYKVFEQIDGMREGWRSLYHDTWIRPELNITALKNAWNFSKGHGKKQVSPVNRRTVDRGEYDKNGPTLILYYYHENSTLAKTNLEFFFRHHNPALADVLLLLHGECTAELPDYVMTRRYPYKNEHEACINFRTWSVILNGDSHKDIVEKKSALRWKKYEYFFVLNSKVRGPFYPFHWYKGKTMTRTWVDVFREPLSEEVGMVSSSFNCMKGIRYLKHLQTYSFMTHRAGLELMLSDLDMKNHILGISGGDLCNSSNRIASRSNAILLYEIGLSQSFISRHIGVQTLQTAYQMVDILDDEAVARVCFQHLDTLNPHAYFGKNVHLSEVIFHKTRTTSFQRVDVDQVDLFTVWFDQRVPTYRWKVQLSKRDRNDN